MSRPPRIKHNELISAYNQPVIDFVNKGYPVGTHYEPSVYAQAGYPGYIQGQYQAGPPYPGYALSQAYDPHMYQTIAQPYQYQPISQPAYQQPTYAPLSSGETEEQLREKINSKIDAIIETQRENSKEQRAELLSSQIDKLTRKVQKLSTALEGQRYEKPKAEPLSADADVAERLRALAAESKEAMSRRKLPDW
jgi:hypothetical protein